MTNVLRRRPQPPGSPDAGRRPTTAQLKGLGVGLALVALLSWALASPIGASPDEDFHLASIWCGQGTRPGICEPGPTGKSRLIPAPLMRATCYAFNPNQSAACQSDPPVPTGMAVSERGNFVDGLYPPVYYWFQSLLVSDDVSNSVLRMRLVNSLIFLALVTAVYLLVPPGLRRGLLGGILITLVPLGMFLIASINPSGWALLSAATLLVSTLGYLRTDERRRRIGLGALAGLSLLIGAGARADAAVFALVAIGTALVLTVGTPGFHLRRVYLPLVLMLLAVPAYLSASQTSHADLTAGAEGLELNRLIRIVLSVPFLWTGGLGQWGLGWLDTNMWPAVWIGSWTVFAAVLFVAVAGARGRRALAVGLVALAALVVPSYVQYLSGYPVGAVVQARYVLPLLTLLAVTALLRLDGSAFQITRGQRWFVLAVLASGNALALHTNLRRYVTGTDWLGFGLDRGIEWWWRIPFSPMTIWFAGALAFGAAAVLLTTELAPARTADNAAPAGPDAGTPAVGPDPDRAREQQRREQQLLSTAENGSR